MEFVKQEGESSSNSPQENLGNEVVMIDINSPVIVRYCPVCSLPPEYCEFGSCFDKCLPWIVENCPEVLSEEVLARALGNVSLEEGKTAAAAGEATETTEEKKKPRGAGAAAPRKAAVMQTKIVIARVQRQKRKYITAVAGLETIPDLKIKDAAKLFGRKFSSGASVSEAQGGGQKEVVIQGDVCFDLPNILISEYKVAPEAIFFLEDGSLRPFA
eukprot:gene4470-4896_t